MKVRNLSFKVMNGRDSFPEHRKNNGGFLWVEAKSKLNNG